MEYKIFLQDSDSHWFLIPASLMEEFEKLLEAEDYKNFNDKFWKYVCDYPKWTEIITKEAFEEYKKKLEERWYEVTDGAPDLDFDTLEYIY